LKKRTLRLRIRINGDLYRLVAETARMSGFSISKCIADLMRQALITPYFRLNKRTERYIKQKGSRTGGQTDRQVAITMDEDLYELFSQQCEKMAEADGYIKTEYEELEAMREYQQALAPYRKRVLTSILLDNTSTNPRR